MPNVFKSSDVVKTAGRVLLPDAPAPKPQPLPTEEDLEKVLPPAQQRELMLERAKREAGEAAAQIIGSAQAEREKILTQGKNEAVQICEQAREQGYTEAIESKTKEVAALIGEVQKTLSGVHTMLDTYMVRYEKELTKFAIAIAEKVICQKISDDDKTLVELVKTALGTVRTEGYITVEVSEALPGLVAQLRLALSAKQGANVEVKAKDLPPDSCMIQTSQGVVDASVHEQLKNLKELLSEEE